mgnify:CR=1 FL=1|tara:strand:- start:1044 stop:1340 length:297 start_codon:yes stop_codon:yes gene_type:complete
MKCSESMMKYTGYLHILALAVAIYGTYTQIDSVKSGKAYSPALAIALTVMLLLRVPNQICVATREFHGWYSVFGTIMGAAGFAFLGYMEYQQSKKQKN